MNTHYSQTNSSILREIMLDTFIFTNVALRLLDIYIGISDFELYKVISVGHFAEVMVVKQKNIDNVYIAKRLCMSGLSYNQEVSDMDRVKRKKILTLLTISICF